MKRFIQWAVIAATIASALAGESRIPISGPARLTTPGSYIVTRDILTDGVAITVEGAAAVTIDLNGHNVGSQSFNAISVVNGARATISNGRVMNSNQGIFVSNASLVLSQVEVAVLTGGTGINALEPVALAVTDSRVDGDVGISIYTHVPTRFTIASTSVNGAHNAVVVNGSLGCTGGEIVNNVLVSQTDAALIVTGQEAGLVIRGNTVTTGMGTAIYAAGLGGHLVDSNVVRGAAGSGIQVTGNGSRVTNNVVSASGLHGIDVSGSHNVLEANQLDSNGGNGLNLTGAANVYRNNVARNNTAGQYNAGAGNTDAGGNY